MADQESFKQKLFLLSIDKLLFATLLVFILQCNNLKIESIKNDFTLKLAKKDTENLIAAEERQTIFTKQLNDSNNRHKEYLESLRSSLQDVRELSKKEFELRKLEVNHKMELQKAQLTSDYSFDKEMKSLKIEKLSSVLEGFSKIDIFFDKYYNTIILSSFYTESEEQQDTVLQKIFKEKYSQEFRFIDSLISNSYSNIANNDYWFKEKEVHILETYNSIQRNMILLLEEVPFDQGVSIDNFELKYEFKKYVDTLAHNVLWNKN